VNSIFLKHRRRKYEALLQEEGAKESGSVIGYWLLPTQGGYVKLKILESYGVQTNSGGFFGKKLGSGKVVQVKTLTGGRYLPVWPVMNSIDVLKKFFGWVSKISQEIDSKLWSSDSEEREESAAQIQAEMIKRGFCFVIRDSETVHWCGTNQELLKLFLMEISGMRTFNPPSLSILYSKYDPQDQGESEVVKLSLLSPSGNKVKSMTVDSAFRSLFKNKKTFAQYINSVKSPIIGNFYRGEVRWDSAKDWKGIDPDRIRSAIDLSDIADEYRRSSNKKLLLETIKIFLAYAKQNNVKQEWDPEEVKRVVEELPELGSVLVPVPDKGGLKKQRPIYSPTARIPKPPTVSESTFKELLDDTLMNGGYKVGGLRRIGRLWVYDRSIPGRVDNSRFVVTRRPSLQLDRDGYPIYRFQFRSRPDRNTTNMSHAGYIKFIDGRSTGFISRIKGYFKDEIDLQVHVHCACPDFKYRWHWVLAKNGCSHKPTGVGFDAIDSPPRITNPNGLISMCKHLVVAKDYLLMSASEHYKVVRDLQKSSSLKRGSLNDPDTRGVKPDSEVSDND